MTSELRKHSDELAAKANAAEGETRALLDVIEACARRNADACRAIMVHLASVDQQRAEVAALSKELGEPDPFEGRPPEVETGQERARLAFRAREKGDNSMSDRDAYLASVRAKLIARRDGQSPPITALRSDAPTFALEPVPAIVHRDVNPESVVSAQPSPYSESERHPSPLSHLAEELAALAMELTPDSVEVLVLVARRLQRAEERKPC